jgi:hypothetical protein
MHGTVRSRLQDFVAGIAGFALGIAVLFATYAATRVALRQVFRIELPQPLDGIPAQWRQKLPWPARL